MRIVKKPWGHENIWAETPSYLGKILVIIPGHRLSRQYHNRKEETFMVLSGVLTLEIGAGTPEDPIVTKVMYEGESFHCPPKTVHRMINQTENYQPVHVLEVSTNHLDDVVRLEDDYKR
jgi:mannose-6-phosphate isomerase-like protein (cupin superfamily)